MPCNSATNSRKSVDILLEPPRAKSAFVPNSNTKKSQGQPTPTGGYSERGRANSAFVPNSDKKQARDPPTATGYLKAGLRNQSRRSLQINKPTTLPKRELERLHNAAKIISTDDRIESQLQREESVKRIEEEAERQKQMFKQIDEARLQARGEKDKEDLFEEERLKILEQSFIAKHEQEEEVKRVNQIMLNAKCHAIRDAQIQEKIELARELKQEENRLEKMMIDRAMASLHAEDEGVKREQEKKHQYAAEIKSQLMERENQRFLEAERIEEEAKVLSLANEAIKKDDERRARLIKERREQLRSELNRICEMSNLFKKMLFEQEREAEMRIHAYMKAKEKRERTLDIEKKLAKQAFERKQQLLFDLQQKILESKSKREEMALTRQQENIEREYRRKEKEAVIRKKELEKSLHEARNAQLLDAKLREALQIARNEDDFQKIVENLKREEAKQAKIQEERLKNKDRYRDEIIRQMNDKENERRRKYERDQSEAIEWKEREKQREKNVRSVIQAKLASMRDANLPEKYIKDVERQMLKISEQKKSMW
ncbi:cilia- and flagella-associated protein 45 [Episyrphus balteatus]|uniref:cilia- and flagella-associated protein 45 n=1 Tax=Episyrphus balteatus TaxID=286459 RepID=UPI0024855805|nr:cilia- and flagella-associated protein 45 [Episyrphus balteatus]